MENISVGHDCMKNMMFRSSPISRCHIGSITTVKIFISVGETIIQLQLIKVYTGFTMEKSLFARIIARDHLLNSIKKICTQGSISNFTINSHCSRPQSNPMLLKNVVICCIIVDCS